MSSTNSWCLWSVGCNFVGFLFPLNSVYACTYCVSIAQNLGGSEKEAEC